MTAVLSTRSIETLRRVDSSVMGVGAARRERRARESAERYYTPGSDSGQREAAAGGPAGENVNHRAERREMTAWRLTW